VAKGSEALTWRLLGGKHPCTVCGGVLRIADVREHGTLVEVSGPRVSQRFFVVGVCCWDVWNKEGRKAA